MIAKRRESRGGKGNWLEGIVRLRDIPRCRVEERGE